MQFFSITVSPHIGALTEHESYDCSRDIVDGFRSKIEHPKVTFRWPSNDFEIHYTNEQGAALITIYKKGIPLSISALLTGHNKAGDAMALDCMWEITDIDYKTFSQVNGSLRTGMDVEQRPIIVTSILPLSAMFDEEVIGVVAQLEMHFAAAFFEGICDNACPHQSC